MQSIILLDNMFIQANKTGKSKTTVPNYLSLNIFSKIVGKQHNGNFIQIWNTIETYDDSYFHFQHDYNLPYYQLQEAITTVTNHYFI